MGEFPAGATAVIAPGSPDNTTRCTKTSGASEPPCLRPRHPARLVNSPIRAIADRQEVAKKIMHSLRCQKFL